MRIVQEELYKKIEYAFDRLELEINLIHGVLPMNTEYTSVNDPSNVEVHGQTTPEERYRSEMERVEDDSTAVEGEIID